MNTSLIMSAAKHSMSTSVSLSQPPPALGLPVPSGIPMMWPYTSIGMGGPSVRFPVALGARFPAPSATQASVLASYALSASEPLSIATGMPLVSSAQSLAGLSPACDVNARSFDTLGHRDGSLSQASDCRQNVASRSPARLSCTQNVASDTRVLLGVQNVAPSTHAICSNSNRAENVQPTHATVSNPVPCSQASAPGFIPVAASGIPTQALITPNSTLPARVDIPADLLGSILAFARTLAGNSAPTGHAQFQGQREVTQPSHTEFNEDTAVASPEWANAVFSPTPSRLAESARPLYDDGTPPPSGAAYDGSPRAFTAEGGDNITEFEPPLKKSSLAEALAIVRDILPHRIANLDGSSADSDPIEPLDWGYDDQTSAKQVGVLESPSARRFIMNAFPLVEENRAVSDKLWGRSTLLPPPKTELHGAWKRPASATIGQSSNAQHISQEAGTATGSKPSQMPGSLIPPNVLPIAPSDWKTYHGKAPPSRNGGSLKLDLVQSHLLPLEEAARRGLQTSNAVDALLETLTRLMFVEGTQNSEFADPDPQQIAALLLWATKLNRNSVSCAATCWMDTTLLRRDSMISNNSSIKQEDVARVRTLPLDTTSLFGPALPKFVKEKTAESKEELLARASLKLLQPQRFTPPKRSHSNSHDHSFGPPPKLAREQPASHNQPRTYSRNARGSGGKRGGGHSRGRGGSRQPHFGGRPKSSNPSNRPL